MNLKAAPFLILQRKRVDRCSPLIGPFQSSDRRPANQFTLTEVMTSWTPISHHRSPYMITSGFESQYRHSNIIDLACWSAFPLLGASSLRRRSQNFTRNQILLMEFIDIFHRAPLEMRRSIPVLLYKGIRSVILRRTLSTPDLYATHNAPSLLLAASAVHKATGRQLASIFLRP